MKKVLLVLLVAAGIGVGAFIYLREYLAKVEIGTRIDDLISQSGGLRLSLATKDSDLLAFFDLGKYDPQAPNPYLWIETWKYENRSPDFERSVKELQILEHDKTDARVEFTLQEGLRGDEKKGIAAQKSEFRYQALLVFDSTFSLWKIRSLRRTGS